MFFYFLATSGPFVHTLKLTNKLQCCGMLLLLYE